MNEQCECELSCILGPRQQRSCSYQLLFASTSYLATASAYPPPLDSKKTFAQPFLLKVYFCVQTRSRAQWGQQGALLNGLLEAEIFRRFSLRLTRVRCRMHRGKHAGWMQGRGLPFLPPFSRCWDATYHQRVVPERHGAGAGAWSGSPTSPGLVFCFLSLCVSPQCSTSKYHTAMTS